MPLLPPQDASIGVPDVVRLELLAGAGTDEQVRDLQRLPGRFLHRRQITKRRQRCTGPRATPGATVRSLLDCLVAAAALRTDSALLVRDRDIEVIAR